MTSPAGGGRPIAVGQAPVMLTEYANAGRTRVINNSTQLVYLASDSSVSASYGIPLQPLTSMGWQQNGQIWAVADAGDTGPAQLIPTDAVTDWTPSPAQVAALLAQSGININNPGAIGSSVAQSAYAQGIPGVPMTGNLFDGAIANGHTQIVNIANAATIAIDMLSGTTIQVALFDANDAPLLLETFTNATPAGSGTWQQVLLAAENAAQAQITARTASTVSVTGSNVLIAGRTDTRLNYTGVTHAIIFGGSTALTANTTYSAPLLNSGGGQAVLQGEYYARFAMSNGTAAKGSFGVTDANGVGYTLADTVEFVTGQSGFYYVQKMIAVPACTTTIQFYCATAGSSLLRADLTAVER